MNKITENEIISSEYDTLVLSGASTKGFLLLGAIQYTYDNYFNRGIKTFIGTSAGAMISYLICIGYTPIEIVVYICTNQCMEKIQHFNIVGMLQGRGASSFHVIHETLEKMTIDKIGYLPTLLDIYEKFDKTLICVTHNITEDKTEYLSYENYPHIPCLTALRMSGNLPLIFDNYKYGHCFYVDGAISDNFAIQLAEENGNKILGINIKLEDSGSEINDLNTLEYIYKLFFIPVTQSTNYKIKQIKEKSTIITLETKKIKAFDFNINSKERLEMFSSGYEQISELFKK